MSNEKDLPRMRTALAIIVIMSAMGYAGCAFISWRMNPGDWAMPLRIACALVPVLSVFGCALEATK